MTKKKIKKVKEDSQNKEFREYRTYWKWFDRIYYKKHSIAFQAGVREAFTMRVLLEILKELQYMNDSRNP